MSIKLSKNDTSPYDYFSEGDGSDPVTRTATVDESGGNVNTSVLSAFVVATDYSYTGIVVDSINNDTGITWQLSTDNTTFTTSVTLPDMDASANDIKIPIYIRAVVANDGSIGTGIYTNPDIRITYTESP